MVVPIVLSHAQSGHAVQFRLISRYLPSRLFHRRNLLELERIKHLLIGYIIQISFKVQESSFHLQMD